VAVDASNNSAALLDADIARQPLRRVHHQSAKSPTSKKANEQKTQI
jgi:hypothetical protein